jgi:hypothetical protein
MTPTLDKIASALETHREELTTMLDIVDKSPLPLRSRAEVMEQLTRARQAVGLARATLIGKE